MHYDKRGLPINCQPNRQYPWPSPSKIHWVCKYSKMVELRSTMFGNGLHADYWCNAAELQPNCQCPWHSILMSNFSNFTVFAIVPEWLYLEALFLGCVLDASFSASVCKLTSFVRSSNYGQSSVSFQGQSRNLTLFTPKMAKLRSIIVDMSLQVNKAVKLQPHHRCPCASFSWL